MADVPCSIELPAHTWRRPDVINLLYLKMKLKTLRADELRVVHFHGAIVIGVGGSFNVLLGEFMCICVSNVKIMYGYGINSFS